MLTLNRQTEQLGDHSIPLPGSWPEPKFSFNQLVGWDAGKPAQGIIIGLEYHDGCRANQTEGWAYSIVVDPDCPYLAGLVCANPEMEFLYESDLILIENSRTY